ncbi:MAG: glycosyltransferase family 2 protein [Deltaproteobacteria bacterium]|nr:glycosyltransferase family 2 protein [Deltaproteobacteria bacterium]MBW2066216.1 glycosyltransferase family 2 protein [Deltaproteobacteria bacterium]
MAMHRLSAIIITKDEEKTIERCLQSILWTDEIIVVDSYSSDNTVEICRSYTSHIYQRPFDNFQNQRNYALEKATGEWILSIDADEIVGPALQEEILRTIEDPGPHVGFYIPMESFLFNQPVRYTWGQNYLLRLFKREKARFSSPIHEKVKIDGSVGYLRTPFQHYNSDTLEQFIAKNNLYTTLEARKKFEGGERFSPLKAFFSPLRIFVFRYFRLKGYRDGSLGLFLSALLAVFNLLLHMKMWELSHSDKKSWR